jgi:hypothetical protein
MARPKKELSEVKPASKYLVDKGFRHDEIMRNKGSVVELAGDELMFALENKCVTKQK